MSKKSRKSKEETGTSVQAAVKRLRNAAKAMKATRSRYAAYTFLLEIYRCYWEWLDRGWAEKRLKSLSRKLGLHRQKNQQPFKMLIKAANCSLDAKLRSRWVRALEYALSEETHPNDLIVLFNEHGGIVGCARLAAENDPKRGAPRFRDDWADDRVSTTNTETC